MSINAAPNAGQIPQRHHIDRRAGKLAVEIAAGGDPDQLLSDSELAELSGLSVQWFQIGRVRGYAPPFIRLSTRRVRTRRGDYVRWLQDRAHLSTAEYADPAAPRQGRKLGSRIVGGKVVEPVEGGDVAKLPPRKYHFRRGTLPPVPTE